MLASQIGKSWRYPVSSNKKRFGTLTNQRAGFFEWTNDRVGYGSRDTPGFWPRLEGLDPSVLDPSV